ncbi:hypothetical protein LXA43DRAFT_358555 [Ganoderma leucocontextum]|nr:hypothetical protein LXA43DRAFT_358555 [Ganoderma leucocontextum]
MVSDMRDALRGAIARRSRLKSSPGHPVVLLIIVLNAAFAPFEYLGPPCSSRIVLPRPPTPDTMFSASLCAFLVALAATASVVSAAPGLSLKITEPNVVNGVENLKVITTLTNTGDEALKLLNDPNSVLKTLPANTFTYGWADAQALAQSNPDEAVFNADSHEYFIENIPSQP